LWVRRLPPHLARRLIFPQPFIGDLAEQIVGGLGQKLDL